MRLYGKIEKIDTEKRIVSGYASTEAKDNAGETVLKSAVEAALTDYLEFANIREMHQLSAVGTAQEATTDDKGLYLVAHIVDDSAWDKVTKGVYKGFSIGGRTLARDPDDRKVITKIMLNEISLVDRPSNPEARFDVWKAAIAETGDSSMAKTAEELTEIERKVRADAAESLAKALKDAGIVSEPDAEALAKAAADKVIADEALAKAEAAKVEADTLAKTIADSAEKAASDKAIAAALAAMPEAERAAALAKAAETVVVTVAPVVEGADVVDAIAKATAKVDELTAALEPVGETDALSKGMYDVSRFAELLSSMSYLAQASDGMKITGKLRKAVATLAEVFKDMAAEEVDKLIGDVTVAKAAEAEAIAKAAGKPVGGLADATATEALAKATALADDLAKGLAARDEALTKLADRLDPLIKTVEEMKTRLIPPKAAGAGAALSKGDDAGGSVTANGTSADDIASALSKMTDDDRQMVLTKAALKVPHVKTFR